jgi:hypothetical protein
MQLIQIVPHLPPSTEGVGSHAEALAGALAEKLGIETRFATGADALGEEESTPVLLHYANYGYQSRGCPVGLIQGLSRWRRRGGGRRLVTVFHEVWAAGPPWRSSFWLAPVQQHLAATLAQLSTGMITSLELYGQMVRPWAGPKAIRVVPVFSTIGEPAEVPPWEARARRMIVFGGAGVRSRAWGRELAALAAACRALDIEEIVDVGPPAAVPERVGAIPVRTLGILPAAEVGALLAGSRAGFLSYPPPFLPKSTIFAAYCAHGLAPVCAWSRQARNAGPIPPLWGTGIDPEASGERARAWYGEHTLDRQASLYGELLG